MYNYNHTVRDVLYFLDTGNIEHRNTTNTEAWSQFLNEIEIQKIARYPVENVYRF